jgi:hypothetical protein
MEKMDIHIYQKNGVAYKPLWTLRHFKVKVLSKYYIFSFVCNSLRAILNFTPGPQW